MVTITNMGLPSSASLLEEDAQKMGPVVLPSLCVFLLLLRGSVSIITLFNGFS